MATLYEELKASGATLDNHESDLYTPLTVAALEIVKRHGVYYETFAHSGGGARWLDVPFMYHPWWEAKRRARQSSLTRSPRAC